MPTIINVDTKFKWKIDEHREDHCFWATCERLKLEVHATTFSDLMLYIGDAMALHFKRIYATDDLNTYAFSHSIAYKPSYYNGEVEVSVPPIQV